MALTVREAFEKAGHPVPEGARLEYSEDNWSYLHEDRTTHWGLSSERWAYSSPYTRPVTHFDLSNLPARDALEALPQEVRKVVEDE